MSNGSVKAWGLGDVSLTTHEIGLAWTLGLAALL